MNCKPGRCTRCLLSLAPRRVAVDAAEIDPLVGMLLRYGYELTVQAVEGGQVLIKALP